MFCGFNEKMVYGIGVFAEGLFEATLAKARERGTDVETAFRAEVAEIGLLLEALEEKSEQLKQTHGPAERARAVVEWMADRKWNNPR